MRGDRDNVICSDWWRPALSGILIPVGRDFPCRPYRRRGPRFNRSLVLTRVTCVM